MAWRAPERNAPKVDEFEISLFGPSYGECVVVHAGEGAWFVIDSCSVPGKKEPRALEYLTAIGVDVSKAVRLIVVTHWDDDHIRGIADLVEAAKNSKFVISAAIFSEELIALIKLYENQGLTESGGVSEFTKVLNLLKERGMRPELALEQKTLWNRVKSGIETGCLVALAPSSATVLDGHISNATIFQGLRLESRRIPDPDRNHRSVVLWLKVGNARALLGSDLLEIGDPRYGWSAILLSDVTRPPAQMFKVPHHGSVTAHHDDVWSRLLIPNVPALIAPWRKGSGALPTKQDIERIQSKTNRIYVSAVPQNKVKPRPIEVQSMIDATARKIRLVDEYPGQIRLRTNLNDSHCDWKVALFGGAKLITGRMSKAFPNRA